MIHVHALVESIIDADIHVRMLIFTWVRLKIWYYVIHKVTLSLAIENGQKYLMNIYLLSSKLVILHRKMVLSQRVTHGFSGPIGTDRSTQPPQELTADVELLSWVAYTSGGARQGE